MSIKAFPLNWPVGWKRTTSREHAKFGRREKSAGESWARLKDLSVEQAVRRVRAELERMGIDDVDCVISTNLKLRMDGWPRSDQANPQDPGVAVYWRDRNGNERCMAVDRYVRVADNIAAVAATLDALRAVQRHGGAVILDRAFTGFTGLPAPEAKRQWHEVLGVASHTATNDVRDAYRRARSAAHHQHGGTTEQLSEVLRAWADFRAERGIDE